MNDVLPVLGLLRSARGQAVRRTVEMGPASAVFGPVILARDWDELHELIRRYPRTPALADRREPPPWPAPASLPLATLTGDSVSGDPVVLSALVRAVTRPVVADSLRRVPAEARRIVALALARAGGPFTVASAAAELGVSRRTLVRRCAMLGLPSPKKLLSLARMLAVEQVADGSRQPAGAVAVVLGFPDSSSYRRLVRNAFRMPPSGLRRRGGAVHVAEAIFTGAGLHARSQATPPASARSTRSSR